MHKLLALSFLILLAGCGMQHAGCPDDLPTAPDDNSGVKSAIRTCN